MTRAVLVPSTLLLLPDHVGLVDPAPALRAACHEAVARLVRDAHGAVGVVASPVRPDNLARGVLEPAGLRIARHLLTASGWSGEVTGPAADVPLLVVGNGSACRSETAPGHLDPRAARFDAALGDALARSDREALAAVDARLADELWCHDVPAFHRLAELLAPGPPAEVRFAEAPFGVQYWVVRWP